jgi:DNA replication protein DnaC
VLLLDDLDKLHIRQNQAPGDRAGSYQQEKLFEVLNSRYVAKLPTMITTNEEDDLERWLGQAVLSRILGNVMLLNMNSPDYRLSGSGAFGR